MRAFKIRQQIRSMTFKLELSKHFKAHFIVHVALLESASENAKLMKIMNVEEYKNQDYIIEKILEKNQILFLFQDMQLFFEDFCTLLNQFIIMFFKKLLMIMKMKIF